MSNLIPFSSLFPSTYLVKLLTVSVMELLQVLTYVPIYLHNLHRNRRSLPILSLAPYL